MKTNTLASTAIASLLAASPSLAATSTGYTPTESTDKEVFGEYVDEKNTNSTEKSPSDANTDQRVATSQNTLNIAFQANSSTLTNDAFNEIKNFVNNLKASSPEEQIVIAVWSDSTYPYYEDNELPEQQQDLAEKRMEALEDTLDSMGYDKYEIVNMSTRPGWFARVFGADESEIKSSYSNAAVSVDPKNKAVAKALKDQGGPTKAVVTVKY